MRNAPTTPDPPRPPFFVTPLLLEINHKVATVIMQYSVTKKNWFTLLSYLTHLIKLHVFVDLFFPAVSTYKVKEKRRLRVYKREVITRSTLTKFHTVFVPSVSKEMRKDLVLSGARL